MVIKNPEFTNLQHRAVIKGYNSALEIRIREFKTCQFKMDTVNRNLCNAKVIYNQVEKLTEKAADADRKTVFEQNTIITLFLSWIICARSVKTVEILLKNYPEEFQKFCETSLAVIFLLRPIAPLGPEGNIII